MRALTEQERRILELAEPEARQLGLQIVRVRVAGSRRPVLQVMTEREDGGVDVEECARLSRHLSSLFDVHEPVAGEYVLEVSSPGIDRPLTRPGDFARWAGHEVRVELAEAIEGRRRYHGYIEAEGEGVVTMRLKDGGEARLAISDMVKAHLVLTDRLIADAQARGAAPTAPLEQFDDVRTSAAGDEDEDDHDEEEFEEDDFDDDDDDDDDDDEDLEDEELDEEWDPDGDDEEEDEEDEEDRD